MLLIAVDPGVTGALAFKYGGETSVEDIPVEKVRSGKGYRSRYRIGELADLLRSATNGGAVPAVAVVEHVSPNGQNGVIANFSLGEGFGIIQGVMATLGIRVVLVSPRKWKNAMGLDADKEASRQKALEHFPQLSEMLSRKKDHNRSEALLLLEYAEKNNV